MSAEIKQVNGKAFCLLGKDIDTDRIIPARYLKCVTFKGLGEHVFKSDRAGQDGKHPFDLPENQGKSILVVGENFGSGSSREHAVVALTQWGIKAIVGLSFAKIFRDNAISYGLACIEVKPENHNDLVSAIEGQGVEDLEINLETMEICVKVFHDGTDPFIPCFMPEAVRYMFVNGSWDMLQTCLEAGDLIEAAAARLPYMTATVG